MKNLLKYSLLLAFFFYGCGTYEDLNLLSFSLSRQERQFITDFENAVLRHRVKDLRTMLHPVYVDQQLNDMYEGNARALFNSFFCGKDVQTKKFVCIKLRNVRGIELIKVMPGSEAGEKRLIFRVEGYDHTILVELYMKPYSKDGQAKLGIIGAFG